MDNGQNSENSGVAKENSGVQKNSQKILVSPKNSGVAKASRVVEVGCVELRCNFGFMGRFSGVFFGL
jgi:hypothetical protein